MRLALSSLVLLSLPLRADDATTSNPVAKRPNIVWLLSEDNSVHYMKLYGAKHGETPNIAKLASEGLLFEHAFSNSPVCSVARTTLQTGMYGPRIGAQFHRKTIQAELPDGAKLFPTYLRDAGYYTTNNSKEDYNVVGGKAAWNESSKQASWRKRPQPETPFFHMQSFGTSHESSLHFSKQVMQNTRTEVDPADVVLGPQHPDTPTFRYTQARYHDRMQQVDAEIGKVVAQLVEDDLLEDTIVFYFGDHGGVLPGSKGYTNERGLHVPLVVRVGKNVRLLTADRVPNSRVQGFVSFIDFGATVLNLAGVEVPETMDGRPFLGPGVRASEVDARDEAFGHADRFDEKYDLVRTLRKGRFKYVRNYEAHLPDGLQNNYRYKMLAYTEWRELHHAGKLNAAQSLFFERKPAEALYDIEADPYELNNLAGDDSELHRAALLELRGKLREWVKGMPDTSFATEHYLIAEALPRAAEYARRLSSVLRSCVDVADLALLPFEEARPRLKASLEDDRYALHRYWALTACASFGEEAKPLAPIAREMLDDENDLVRVRAAEFLGSIKAADPVPTLLDVLATSDDYGTAAIALNAVVYLRDEQGYEFAPADIVVRAKGDTVNRRLEYLKGGRATKPRRRSAKPQR